MKTDCELLGIPETEDISVIRSAYRRIAKAVHPDVSSKGESLRNHLVFIEATKAYERLVKRMPKGQARHDVTPRAPAPGGSGLVPHKDPAYACYKTAMSYFGRIHPSYWHMHVKNALDLPSPAKEQELARIQSRTHELMGFFPKAYYYFAMVAHEYPESIWTQDAVDKMKLIEERTPLYEKIITSFAEHAKVVPRVNNMFRGRNA